MKSVSIKVWVETRKLLRLISAMTDESIQDVVQRLAQAEWDRLKREELKEDEPEGVNLEEIFPGTISEAEWRRRYVRD